MTKLIFKTNVETDHPDIVKCKTVEELKKLEIFNHLSEQDQEAAYKELLEGNKKPQKAETKA